MIFHYARNRQLKLCHHVSSINILTLHRCHYCQMFLAITVNDCSVNDNDNVYDNDNGDGNGIST